jgi:predicted ribosomally synthesized peptide with SipW-like signal peptide
VNKKIILGIVGLLGVGSLVAVGSQAYFSQKGEVKSNVFSTGTLSLKLSDNDESGSDETSATWHIAAGAPGDEVSGTVNIKNAGNIAADHIEVTATNTVTDAASGPGTEGGTPLDRVLQITELTYDGASVLDQVADRNGNLIKDLDDLEPVLPEDEPALDNLPLTDFGDDAVNHPLVMTIQFNPTKTVAEHQGDSATTTLTVTLNQVASQ